MTRSNPTYDSNNPDSYTKGGFPAKIAAACGGSYPGVLRQSTSRFLGQRTRAPAPARDQRLQRPEAQQLGANNPKTEARVAGVQVAPVAIGATHPRRITVVSPASYHIPTTLVRIATPLPHVASHVEQAIRTSPFGVVAHGRSPTNDVVEIAEVTTGRLVSPRICATVRAARCLFPLLFRGQP